MTRRYLLVVVALTLAHAAIAVAFPISGDEAYYWDCARHLDWSYFDQPPLAIWIVAAARTVLGDVRLAVRMPAILSALAIGLFLQPLVRRLGGTTRDAERALLYVQAMPVFALGLSYTSTDVVMATCYLAAVWAAIAVGQGYRRAWWGLGLALGLGFLAKFSIVVAFIPAAVALLSPRARADLRTPTPWLAASMSLALTAPVWIWGARHEWHNLLFQVRWRHTGSDFGVKYLLEFVAANVGLASPILAVLLAVGCWRAALRPEPGWRVAVAGALAPFVFFGFVALRTRVGAHWGAPGLAVMTVLMILTGVGGRRVRAAGVTVGVLITAVALGLVAAAPWVAGIEWTYRGRPNKIAASQLALILGNDAIADGVVSRRDAWAHEVGAPPESIYVASQSYTAIHLTAFLAGAPIDTRLLNIAGTHGLASLYWYPPAEFRGRRVLFFTEEERFAEPLDEYFASVEPEPPFVVDLGNAGERRVLTYRCEDPTRPDEVFTRLRDSP